MLDQEHGIGSHWLPAFRKQAAASTVVIARPSITAPIASATSLAQLTDLVESAKLELPASAIDRLNLASASC